MRISGSTTRCVQLVSGVLRLPVTTPMSCSSYRKELAITQRMPASSTTVRSGGVSTASCSSTMSLPDANVARSRSQPGSPCLWMFHVSSRIACGSRASLSASVRERRSTNAGPVQASDCTCTWCSESSSSARGSTVSDTQPASPSIATPASRRQASRRSERCAGEAEREREGGHGGGRPRRRRRRSDGAPAVAGEPIIRLAGSRVNARPRGEVERRCPPAPLVPIRPRHRRPGRARRAAAPRPPPSRAARRCRTLPLARPRRRAVRGAAHRRG